jgi:hypothetical protein
MIPLYEKTARFERACLFDLAGGFHPSAAKTDRIAYRVN